MLRVIIGAVLVAASLAASAGEQPVASENANAMAIARGNACMGCHAIDRKLVGPSFQQVAEKYKGQPQANAHLEKKVKNGGAGVWGPIPMPSHPRMSDADVKTVVAWILTGAQQK